MKLKSAWVLDEKQSLVQKDVYIEQDIIVDANNEKEELDCSHLLVLPGMVNAHYHGTSTVTRGLFMDMPVAQWLNDTPQGQLQQRFVNALNHCTEEEKIQLSLYEYMSMLKQGVTTVFDCRLFQQDYQAKKRAGELCGIRLTLEADDPSQLEDQGLLKTALPLPEESGWSQDRCSQAQFWKQNHPQTMFKAHCMETDLAASTIQSKGYQHTIEAYAQAGLLDEHSVLIHNCKAPAEAIQLAAKRGARMINCPISNLKSQNGVSPLKMMLDQGIEIGLGTDWGRLQFMDVMKCEYLLLRDQHVLNPAQIVWKMATEWGANCCGWPQIGLLKPGMQADLIFIRMDEPDFQPLISTPQFSDVLQNWVFDGRTEWIEHVMVAGQWKVKNRKGCILNEAELVVRQRQLMKKLISETLK